VRWAQFLRLFEQLREAGGADRALPACEVRASPLAEDAGG